MYVEFKFKLEFVLTSWRGNGPGRLGLFLQNVEVEVIVIKVDRDFSEGGDRFA